MTLGKEGEELKEQWHFSDKDAVRLSTRDILMTKPTMNQIGSTAIFNHVGDGVIITHHSEHTLRVMDYPSLAVRESPAAHVGGCVALALDPRGRQFFSFSQAPFETNT